MSDLSGRELEIAVAKALGIHAVQDGGYWRLSGPNGYLDTWQAFTEDGAWESDRPRYLTDPVAFATVLAALDASGRSWTIAKNVNATIHQYRAYFRSSGMLGTDGDTYQEAACRAFVAWKTPKVAR